ncbi:MAG: glycosyltransferase family 4 protein [Pseudomonadota bacterium]
MISNATAHATPLAPTFIVPRYWPNMGGAEQHSRALVQELAKSHRPSVIRFCSTEARQTDYAYAFNQSKTVLDGSVPVAQPGPQRTLRPILKGLAERAPDCRISRAAYRHLTQSTLARQLKQFSGASDLVHAIYNGFTPASVAASKLDRPFVWTPLAHTTKPQGTAWSSSGFRRLYARADALIAMTEYERDWLIDQGAEAARVHVSPMAPLLSDHPGDASAFRKTHRLDSGPIILFLGRLVEYKGYRALLEAAQAIWNTHPNAQLVFAGPADHTAKAILQSAADPRIRYVGTISDDEKNDALAACEMVCVPSTEESLGVVYFEGWMFQKPVIAADIPVMKSVIADGVDGVLTSQLPDQIAIAVNRLLSDPDMARELGCAGKAKVQVQYTWEQAAKTHEAVYRSLL